MSSPERDAGRLAAIDILRGLAILWVVLFHLWGDIVFFPPPPSQYYDRLWNQLEDGGPWQIFTAVTDILFRDGYQGVPLFMLLSGVSLTLAAHRAGPALPLRAWLQFCLQRFRKLLVPYWFGCAFAIGVMATIAWLRVERHGGDFVDVFTHGVTTAKHARVVIDPGMAMAAFTIVPRLIRQHWFFAPSGALWFVVLLVQYYLLFPFLFAAMRRFGALPVLAFALAVTLASNVALIAAEGPLELNFRFVVGLANFRVFEFVLGMAIGWLLATGRPAGLLRVLADRPAAAMFVVGGFALHTAGDLIDASYGRWQGVGDTFIIAGLALMAAPLLVRMRGPAPLPLRPIAFVGVISYAVLIVNDPLRMVASELRNEGIPAGWWWFFLVLYVPVSVAVAWPLAWALGLLPKGEGRRTLAATGVLAAPALAWMRSFRPRPSRLALQRAAFLFLFALVTAGGPGLNAAVAPLSPAVAPMPTPPPDASYVTVSCLDANGDGRVNAADAAAATVDLDGDGFADDAALLSAVDIRLLDGACAEPALVADVAFGLSDGPRDCSLGAFGLIVGIGGSGTNPRDLNQGVSQGVKAIALEAAGALRSSGGAAQVIYANSALEGTATPHLATERWLTAVVESRLASSPCVRVALIGHSYGAVTATSIAAALEERFPDRVAVLALDRTTALYSRPNPPMPAKAPLVNIFQLNEGWHGAPIWGANVVNVNASSAVAPVDGAMGGPLRTAWHSTLDDAPVVRQRAVDAIVAWVRDGALPQP
ncbi:MAG TPA: acyltransferase [Dehalococcoidia bacterium]|nr:acyltransferase [Dehalococcoidia bacterium]